MTAGDLPFAEAAGLWEAWPLPALLLAPEGAVRAANAEAEGFLNAGAARLKGRALDALLSADVDLAAAVQRARAGARVSLPEVWLVRQGTDGPRPAQLCALLLAPLEGLGLLCLIWPREGAALAPAGGGARGAARAAIGMAEMLAHEIKNPLAGISGAAQLLEMGLEGAADRELTGLIVAECRRIVALLEQVERFGDLRPPARQVVNIHDVLEQARRSAAAGFARAMRFEEDYDPSLPATYADPDQLLQVFLNLFKNAAEAAGAKGGRLRLRTSYDGALRDGAGAPLPLQIEVIDDGPGLPPAIAGQVFEPFVSGRENGKGLGLALVSKILTDHGAFITVTSRPGETVFRLSLPRAPKSEPEAF